MAGFKSHRVHQRTPTPPHLLVKWMSKAVPDSALGAEWVLRCYQRRLAALRTCLETSTCALCSSSWASTWCPSNQSIRPGSQIPWDKYNIHGTPTAPAQACGEGKRAKSSGRRWIKVKFATKWVFRSTHVAGRTVRQSKVWMGMAWSEKCSDKTPRRSCVWSSLACAQTEWICTSWRAGQMEMRLSGHGAGTAWGTSGLGDLENLFQPKWFYNSPAGRHELQSCLCPRCPASSFVFRLGSSSCSRTSAWHVCLAGCLVQALSSGTHLSSTWSSSSLGILSSVVHL